MIREWIHQTIFDDEPCCVLSVRRSARSPYAFQLAPRFLSICRARSPRALAPSYRSNRNGRSSHSCSAAAARADSPTSASSRRSKPRVSVPDIVAGSSSGAIVAALYAAGHSGAELERIAVDLRPERARRFCAVRKGLGARRSAAGFRQHSRRQQADRAASRGRSRSSRRTAEAGEWSCSTTATPGLAVRASSLGARSLHSAGDRRRRIPRRRAHEPGAGARRAKRWARIS